MTDRRRDIVTERLIAGAMELDRIPHTSARERLAVQILLVVKAYLQDLGCDRPLQEMTAEQIIALVIPRVQT